MPTFDMGDRVTTPQGPGKINYRRMAPPTYMEVDAYSVRLDHKVRESEQPPFPSYSGTMFPASEVKSETE